jgi:hypothetical protein
VNALPYPPYIAFTFENRGVVGDQPTHELLRVLVRTDDGVAVMTVIRDFRGDALAKPRATVVSQKLDFLNVSNVLRLGDFPLADFGLRYVRPARPDFFETDAPGAATPSIKVIATVGATSGPQYQLADPEIVDIDEKRAYHFTLARRETRSTMSCVKSGSIRQRTYRFGTSRNALSKTIRETITPILSRWTHAISTDTW